MVNATEINPPSVIKQKDPLFAERPHLDFQFLRREGLQHLGELSGKIWTDHNAHDPGVTMLEVLCYALMDLGYRTQLDFVDLIAAPSSTGQTFHTHHNFFTPLEILSCNPTTIIDYRKLILEVPGVRNAWVEPVMDQALSLPDSSPEGKSPVPILLNGLYDIKLELEADADKQAISRALCTLLSVHRNLGEDFQKLTFLEPCAVGIAADVELARNTPVEEVYTQILEAVQAYISPEIRYYTLKELLGKGKRIEEIFAGRSYREESYGFVDTEELQNLPLRHTLYASDLYQAILKIPGVNTVQKIAFKAPEVDATLSTNIPYLCIPKDCIAQFDLAQMQISFSIAGEKIDFNQSIVHQKKLIKGKPKVSRLELDLPIPKGDHRPDLGQYWSVQHEFPLVYGIGEGGLPSNASLQRKAQALQLKAYLLFYDQLLANYMAQLSNLQHLFSLQQESKKAPALKRTYFSQALDNVPLIEKLLQPNLTKDLKNSFVMATPVANDARLSQQLKLLLEDGQAELKVDNYCFNQLNALDHYANQAANLCDIHIRQSIRDTGQGEYRVEIHQDKNGYFFILRFTQTTAWVFIGSLRYRSIVETREAANFATFLATNMAYYQKNKLENNEKLVYQFDLVYQPDSYVNYLQYLLEDEQLYYQRREALLDHLLGRFASQFTDYSLLRFGATTAKGKELQHSVENKSRFLAQYDELSRNRGQAFNYLEASWNTENVSGYEKRVTILGGLNDWKRRSLCKFEVVPSRRLVLPNLQGEPWLSSIAIYPSDQDLAKAWADLQEVLRNPNRYDELKGKFIGFDPLSLRKMFSEIPDEGNILAADWQYIPNLIDAQGNVLSLRNAARLSTQSQVKTTIALLTTLNEALAAEGKAIELAEILADGHWYLNQKQLHLQIQGQTFYNWHQYDVKGRELLQSKKEFSDETSALADFINQGDLSSLLNSVEHAVSWSFQVVKGIDLVGKAIYASAEEAQRAVLLHKSIGQLEQFYRIEPAPLGAIKVLLLNQKGNILAEALIPAQHNTGPETLIKTCCQRFAEEIKELKYPRRGKAYTWRFEDTKGATLLCSVEAYTDAHQAIQCMQEALVCAAEGKNFQKTGKNVLSGFAWFLLDTAGEYLGTSPELYFKTTKEREASLNTLKKEGNKLLIPFKILAGTTQHHWALRQVETGQKILESTQAFDSPQAAAADFVAQLQAFLTQGASAFISSNVYRIEYDREVVNYQYVYELNSPSGELLPYLVSEEKFPSIGAAQRAYTQMIRKLPDLRLQTEADHTRVTDGGEIVLRLSDERPEHKKRTQDLLDYHQQRFQSSTKQAPTGKWIYRWMDKDQPLAIAPNPGKTKAEAASFLARACHFVPAPLDWKKSFLRVICPELNPAQFHYALCLPTEAGQDHLFLISYLGYETEAKALAAGQEQWLELIELAALSSNYGEGKPLGLLETYSKSIQPCAGTEPYLAVLSSAFRARFGDQAVAEATALAQRFPLRSIIKEESKDGQITAVRRYYFRGYDLNLAQEVWQSARDYTSLEEVKEAYLLFLLGLKNPNGCRLVCEEGKYLIQLWEILAESREFDTETEAWEHLGSESVVDASSFIPFPINELYQFMIVGKAYRLARHTCLYTTAQIRDKWMEDTWQWAKALVDPVEGESYAIVKKGGQYIFRLYGPDYDPNLQQDLKPCGCEKEEPSPDASPYCKYPYIFESTQVYPTETAARQAFEKFLDCLKNRKAYEPNEQSGMGPYSFEIIDLDEVLAIHPNLHPDLNSAKGAAERTLARMQDEGLHLVEHILLRPTKEEEQECLLPGNPNWDCALEWQDDDDDEKAPFEEVENATRKIYYPSADPYSFWATLVLPSWLQRFRRPEDRNLFASMLHREAPALLGLHILWLDPQQMCQFEAGFRQWLDWFRNPHFICEGNETVYCNFVNLISTLLAQENAKDEQPTPDRETDL